MKWVERWIFGVVLAYSRRKFLKHSLRIEDISTQCSGRRVRPPPSSRSAKNSALAVDTVQSISNFFFLSDLFSNKKLG